MTTAAGASGAGVEVRWADGFAEVLVGDGNRSNALTSAGWRRIEDRVRETASRNDVTGLLVRGREGSFCAGSDLTEWLDADLPHVEDSFAAMEAAFRAIEEFPLPTVADVRGAAAGAGCQLALACDLRVLSGSARIGMPIARLGILVSPAFVARIVALAGPSVAAELLYAGRLFDATTAAATGLANQVVPDGDMDAAVAGLLRDIRRQPPHALRAAKRALQAALAPLRDATADHDGAAVSEPDFRRGVRSVLHREPITAIPQARRDERRGGRACPTRTI